MQASSIVYLLDHHRESVIANREITPKQIQISERLQHRNTISYMQAYRVREALRFEIEGNEGRLFKRMPAIREVALRNDPLNHVAVETSDGRFSQIFMAPHGKLHSLP